MLFHKKEKAPEGQQAGTKPEKPRKVRWAERREPSEAGLERFQDYLQTYSTNKDHPIKILCSFYKGKQKKLVETGFFLIFQIEANLYSVSLIAAWAIIKKGGQKPALIETS